MEFDVRLMRLGFFQPWGFYLRGGGGRPLVVSRVIPWSPAYGCLEVGDQILDIEGHLDTELTWQEAESLASLKSNYLRLGIRRLPMFSNQYMGTRLASRSLPRSTSTTAYNTHGPYSRLNVSEAQMKPVNARPDEDGNEEEVDYSFMNLPVRERRKLFLSAERPPTFQPAGADSFTMPRPRAASRPPPSRFETQSEFGTAGEDPFGWEPAVTQTWTAGTRQAPSYATSRATSTSGTIILNSARATNRPVLNQPLEVPVRQYSQYAAPERSPVPTHPPGRFYHTYAHPNRAIYRPQFSTTIRVNDPYSQPMHVTGTGGSGNTRIYPVRRFSTAATPTYYAGPTYTYGTNDQWRPITPSVSGRVSQPLRVNVYNSDASTVNLSPPRRGEPSYFSGSPVYPAYPAHMERPFNVQYQVPAERYSRGQSVQPVTVYARPPSPISHRTTTMQAWRPMQAPNWVEGDRPRRPGRFISNTRQTAVQPQTQEPQEQVGVSDF